MQWRACSFAINAIKEEETRWFRCYKCLSLQVLREMSTDDLVSKIPSLISVIKDIKNGNVSFTFAWFFIRLHYLQVSQCLSYYDFSRSACGKLSMSAISDLYCLLLVHNIGKLQANSNTISAITSSQLNDLSSTLLAKVSSFCKEKSVKASTYLV